MTRDEATAITRAISRLVVEWIGSGQRPVDVPGVEQKLADVLVFVFPPDNNAREGLTDGPI